MPEETETVLGYIARELSHDTYLNLMDQYHPCYRADNYPPLDRPLEANEYRQAVNRALEVGLRRLDSRYSLLPGF
ncbi:MAG: hypothetical protein ABW153_14540 [Sedimenticola sp.]